MQTSDLDSPIIPERLLAQHQQSSPGIDQLIQKAEFENSEQVKLIETEKQRHAALSRQLDEKTRQVEELEKSTTQLDEEAKQLYKQFTQNREICESLKRTNSVLQEHEEALQKKKEMVLAKTQQSRLENQGVLAKYQAIWDRYKKQYERKANAKELEKIKNGATQDEEELEKIKSTIKELQVGISNMEMEKKHMEESIEKGIRSATPVIIKLAQLNLETRATADSLQEVTTKVMYSKDEQARIAMQKEQQNKSPNKETPCTPVHTPMRATLQLGSPPVDHRTSASQPVQAQNQVDKEVELPKDRTMNTQTQDEALPDRLFHGQKEQPAVSSGQDLSRSSAEPQPVQTTSVAQDEHHIHPHLQNSRSALGQNGCSFTDSPNITSHQTEAGTAFSRTPTSTGQQNSGFTPTSEATSSPFNFEMHSNIIQQLTKSPGDGFLFQSRPMFNSSVESDKEQAGAENTNFLFNMQETRNFSVPAGSGGEFQILGQNSNLFGSPVSGKSTSGAGFFGTSLSPLNGCSIFGDTGSDQSNQQQTTGPAEFSFSFGAKSPTTCDNTSNRSTAFSLF